MRTSRPAGQKGKNNPFQTNVVMLPLRKLDFDTQKEAPILAGAFLDGSTHAPLVLLTARLSSSHLCHQTLSAYLDPFHAVSQSRTSVRSAQIAETPRQWVSNVFLCRRTLQAMRASLLAKAVASLLR